MQRYHSIDYGDLATRKRRIQRACDLCRRKKTRCDGARLAGKQQCSNCTAANLACTYLDATKRIPSQRYVECLEMKVNEMEILLREMLPPEADLTEELEKEPIQALPASDKGDLIPNLMRSLGRDITNEKGRSVSEDDYDGALEGNLRKWRTFTDGLFFGKSSHAQLVQTALDTKYGRPAYICDSACSRRPEFWDPLIWHTPSRFSQVQVNVEYTFPDEDLLWSLIDLYFTQCNIFLPVLHRPSFESSVAELTHLNDPVFAAALLAVCAIASRHSTDPRVLIDNEPSSSGWKWMQQILVGRKANSFLTPRLLYDCQSTCLITIFMLGCSVPQTAWNMAGIGLRAAQEAGAHRMKGHESLNNAEAESWRRVFWCLVYLDRYISSALGRPCAINDEDIDTDLPADCDDEYWDHVDPEQAFNQPEGRPSLVSYFNCHMRLTRILMICLRTLYCTNRTKALFGQVEKNWEEQIVAELDSALNTWIDTLPDHLRWDPNRDNLVHFKQSAALSGAYYNLQMLIHRPFITGPRRSSMWPFPSLAICTNAARSCIHVVGIQHQRGGKLPFSGYMVFNAAVVLLCNTWDRQQSGLSVDLKKEIEDVYKSMRILRSFESRWRFTGVLWDVLYQLTSSDLPLASPVSRNKQERDSDYPFDPNERGRSDVQRDAHIARNFYGGSGYPPASEPMDMYAPAPSALPPSSQWTTTSVSMSPQDPQAQWDQPTSTISQRPRSQAYSLPLNSDESGRMSQTVFSDHVPEQDPRLYRYYEHSSISPPIQGPINPNYMPYYRHDGYSQLTPRSPAPPEVYSGGSSSSDSVEVDDRTRTISWDGVPRATESVSWGSYLNNTKESPWRTEGF
ncbi:fungal-specific transcription factor domain-containing protein [Armillaria novae-zelandiae]|uniref:Fungal-specific transcription factor domain-containing protein n=1 Tax=Armillaria novae-zelandiae TaxID=153914 RepID=A0AA39PSL8_9AGAR|nr:fungal-specific transcription factor domain-containing protein [Armillaria novae-zelandiae]